MQVPINRKIGEFNIILKKFNVPSTSGIQTKNEVEFLAPENPQMPNFVPLHCPVDEVLRKNELQIKTFIPCISVIINFWTEERNKSMSESPAKVTEILIKCINFSAIKHKDQRRLDPNKTPYINHPIGVAYILTNEAKVTNVDVIQAAILHDTIEDTQTTFEEIEETFGKVVRDIVMEVTDDKSLPKQKRKLLQIQKAPVSSHEAKLVKLADKLYNLRDLQEAIPEQWTAHRVEEYFEWSKKVVDGLRGTNKSMEDSLDELFKKRGIM